MSMITLLLFYFCLCSLYRNRQINQIFILKSLQTLKINKYRKQITEKVKKHETRLKWFFLWPIVDLYELYEDWKENRNRNSMESDNF